MHVCSHSTERLALADREDMADYVRLSDEAKAQSEGRVGRAGVLVVESMLDAVEQLRPVREAMAAALQTADTPEAAEHAISEALAGFADSNALGDMLFVPLIMADMAGQLMVKGREAQQVTLAADGSAQDPRAFLNLPWPEAIQEFKARGLISDADFSSMISTYASRSTEARARMLLRLQARMMELLNVAIEEGQTLREFGEAVRDGTAELGISDTDPSYLQTVYRTNVQSAYGAGRYRAMADPDIADARPFVQYRTVGDARVRDSHAALDGMVFAIADPEWQRIAPPNGFNCRCSMVTLTADEARGEPRGKLTPDVLSALFASAKSFDGPPVAMVERPIR